MLRNYVPDHTYTRENGDTVSVYVTTFVPTFYLDVRRGDTLHSVYVDTDGIHSRGIPHREVVEILKELREQVPELIHAHVDEVFSRWITRQRDKIKQIEDDIARVERVLVRIRG